MKKQILVHSHADKTNVALLEDGRLAEFYSEDIQYKRTIGTIYRGKVQNVIPGMNIAFVDIGLKKNAFLYVGDLDLQQFSHKGRAQGKSISHKELKIKDYLKVGQEITVQMTHESTGTKGPRVSMKISLPGRYTILLPTEKYTGVSKRIEDSSERSRLKGIAREIVPDNMGIIIRTEAYNMPEAELKDEIKFLYSQWENIVNDSHKGGGPRVLYEDENIFSFLIRDVFSSDINELIITSLDDYNSLRKSIKELLPSQLGKIRMWTKDEDIFDYFKVNTALHKASQSKVFMDNGGYIIIESTEALTVIDVNTGKFIGKNDLEETIFKTNIAAAKTIAQQVRLRDIGGIIVVDFIDMYNKENKARLIECLKEEFKADRTKTVVYGVTHLGLVEITRKKGKRRLNTILERSCPYCEGTGHVSSEHIVIQNIENELLKTKKSNKCYALTVSAHPSITNYVSADNNVLLKILARTVGCRLIFIPDTQTHWNDFSIGVIKTSFRFKKRIKQNGVSYALDD
ncbi:MAG: Rne/Rng family ribonuclease [Clostridiales bacterium]|nr:Rne/Rng family ribonuclease [Clostridiales bacterium]